MIRVDRTDQRAEVDPARGRREGRAAATAGTGTRRCALAARPGDDLRRREQGLQVARSRQTLDGDQPRPHDQHRPRDAVLMGVLGKDTKIAKHDGVAEYRNLVTFAESPKAQGGLYWAGTDDGVVHVTRDAGDDWTNVTSKIPACRSAPTSRGRALAVRRRTASTSPSTATGGDFRTYVFTTADLGKHVVLDLRRTCRRARWCARSPRISRTPTCSIWAPRPVCGSACDRGRSGCG